MRKAFSARLPENTLAEIDQIAKFKGQARTRTIEHLLELGMLYERYSTQLESRLMRIETQLNQLTSACSQAEEKN